MGTMNLEAVIQSIRAEIVKLQRVLDLLLGESKSAASPVGVIRRPGRPRGSGSRAPVAQPKPGTSTKRTMSEEGGTRIAAAQKKRWAASKAPVLSWNAEKRSSPTKAVRKTAPLKLARTAAPAKAQKSAKTGAGSTQAQAERTSANKATSGSRKIPSTKGTAKKSTRRAARQPAKQVAAAASEPQALSAFRNRLLPSD